MYDATTAWVFYSGVISINQFINENNILLSERYYFASRATSVAIGRTASSTRAGDAGLKLHVPCCNDNSNITSYIVTHA